MINKITIHDRPALDELEKQFEDLLVGLVTLTDSKGVRIFRNNELTGTVNQVRLLLREAEDRMNTTSNRYRLEAAITGEDAAQ